MLHATPDLSVGRFDHPPHEAHRDPDREVADRWAIAFVQAGAFDVVVGGARHRLTAGSLFLTWPGLAFRCAHAGPCPDDVCLTVDFHPAALAGALEDWGRLGAPARRVPTPRLAHIGRRLAGAAERGDGFELERWGLASLSALRADAHTGPARGAYAPRAADLDGVIATCRAIEAAPAARLSIAERARGVGRTSPRLTHAFRRYLGISPHQYVIRCRLARAAALLDAGRGVSDACWRSGFENLSHFCRTFQRALGVRPSRWRAVPPTERRRKVQALTRSPS